MSQNNVIEFKVIVEHPDDGHMQIDAGRLQIRFKIEHNSAKLSTLNT